MPIGQHSFEFPELPEEAKLVLELNIAADNSGRRSSAVLLPGGSVHGDMVEAVSGQVFKPQAGKYTLVYTPTQSVVSQAPVGSTDAEQKSIMFVLQDKLAGLHCQLVEALRSFPDAQTITTVAGNIIELVNLHSLRRSRLEVVPVIDVRTVPIEGVECVWGAFGRAEAIARMLENISGEELDSGVFTQDDVKFGIHNNPDGSLIVLIGYLNGQNHFAGFFNREFADCVRMAVADLVEEVITRILVRDEFGRRLFVRTLASMQATYRIDPELVVRRVESLEETARTQLADHLDDEETSGDPSDSGGLPN